MKKTLRSICIAALISCVAVAPINAFAETEQNFDFNSDGLVNGYDVRLLSDRYMEIELRRDDIISDQAVRENIDKNGNLNKDGMIDMRDTAELFNYIRDNNIVGDVNCNGIIDGCDASMILSYYARQKVDNSYRIDGADDGVKMLGDFDVDGIIDARDASKVLNYYVGYL